MNLRVESAHVGGLQVSGGANGLSVAHLAWRKVPRTERHPRARRHGTVDRTRYYEGRLYELAGVLYGVDEEEAQARLDDFEGALALISDDPVVFRWQLAGRTEEEQAAVKIDGDLEYAFDALQPSVVRWALTMFAGDPARYSTTERTGSYDPTEATNHVGILFPATFPLDFAGDSTTHLEVTNAGNFPTPPVFTITGPVTNPIIDNDTTDESIVTQNLELLAGDQVTIDVEARSLVINGAERPDLIDANQTTWYELVSGVNLLRLRGGGMAATQTMLEVSFYDARI